MNDILFPYDTPDAAEPSLSVSAVRLDGVIKPRTIQHEESTVNLYDDIKYHDVEIDLHLTCQNDPVAEYESKHGPITAIVVAHCNPTNTRQPIRLNRSSIDPSRWSGKLELARDNFRNRVELRTILTATVERFSNRPIAFAPSWAIHFDEPESLRIGKTLPIRWENFTLPTASSPGRDFQNSTHVVRFGDKLPELVLNSAFTGLADLLKDRKDRKGAEKGLHDLLRTGMARSVWLVLLADAMAAIREHDDMEGDGPNWPDTPWQTEVLKLILSEIDPAKSHRELLKMAVTDWRDEGAAGEFYSRAEAVIGDLVKSNEKLRRFVSTYRGETNDE